MLKEQRIFLLGGSLNPSGKHHEAMVFAIQKICTGHDVIVIIPCGMRPDKDTTNDIDPAHRANMCRMTFSGMDRVIIDLSDLERDEFMRTWDLEERYQRLYPNAEIWHVVGGDLVKNADVGASDIHTWYRGAELLARSRFVVFSRGEENVHPADLPYHHLLMMDLIPGSSTEIRHKRMQRQCVKDLVVPEVAEYMARWCLYTGRVMASQTDFHPKGPALVYTSPTDPHHPNPERHIRVHHLKKMVERVYAGRTGKPDHRIIIGGDGSMLHGITQYATEPIPFIGLNAGTEGFLLNDGSIAELEERLRRGIFKLYRQPLLHAKYKREDAIEEEGYAFNEVFIQALDQNGWMRVEIDGELWFDRLMGDGLMVSTASGSTGWCASYGGPMMMPGTPQMILLGVGTTCKGNPWKFAPLSETSVVRMEVLDSQKRPMRIRLNGRIVANVTEVTIERSRTQSPEICFFPETDVAKKIMKRYRP